MLASQELSVTGFKIGARFRTLLLYIIFLLAAVVVSSLAFSRGLTTSALLLVAMVSAGISALIFWRPIIGLYSAVLFNIVMEPTVAGDPITPFTDFLHEDLNTTVHAGIAFKPIELLIAWTTLAYLLRAIGARNRLHWGSLGPHVLLFGLFLLAGFIWGFINHGDTKIGLFELRAPFMLVLLYFLVTNLAVEQRQVERLVGLCVVSISVIAIWGIVRFVAVFHGHVGGPDTAFGSVHEDAVLLALLDLVCLVWVFFGGTRGRKVLLIALAVPATIVMLEMQRRAAFLTLFLAAAVVGMALFALRRRLFFMIVPAAVVFVIVYSAAFWNSSSKLAEPIRAWRSQATSLSLGQRDLSSNEYRVIEITDVRITILRSPLTGIGFGRPFLDVVPLVPLPGWPFQFYTPHAEVLWIWLKVGAGGFIAFWLLICTALMRAASLVRRLKASPLGIACLIAALYVVMLLAFAYVDVGLANQRTEILLGAMLGVIGAAPRFVNGTRSVGADGAPLVRAPQGFGA